MRFSSKKHAESVPLSAYFFVLDIKRSFIERMISDLEGKFAVF